MYNMATAASGQLIHTAGPTTITVVANASGQTLLVQPTTIVNHTSSPSHHIIDTRNRNSESVLHSPERSPRIKCEDDGVGNNENNEDNRLSSDRGQKTIVENTHYMTVPVQEPESVTNDGVSHPTYVQYVDGGSDQTIYTTNGQMAYPVYTVGAETAATMYTPSNGQYYQPNTTSPVAYSQVIRVANNINQASNQPQIINNTPYLIQQNIDTDHGTARNNPSNTVVTDVAYFINSGSGTGSTTTNVQSSSNANSSDNLNNNGDSGNNVTHVTRIPPITVQWLLDNYETADGVSLPRSTLYFYYIHHCTESKLDPVNAASFGKLIRSVFLGLRTRRLGTRGNSKYHYYGIRLKPNSPLNNLPVQEENGSFSRSNGNGGNQAQRKFRNCKNEQDSQYNSDQSQASEPFSDESSQSHAQQFLGDGTAAIPDFPEIGVSKLELPEDCSLEDVDTFRSIYREHCEMFLHAIENLEFTTIESLWREFWRCEDNLDDSEEEKYLSKTKLYLLSKCAAVQQFVRYVDYCFYQNLVTVLVPDVLRPIPGSLTQAIRNFAKSLDSWLESAMLGCPREIVVIKASAVGAFSQTLRRYTSLNHLAQAARAVLQNPNQINQMLADLNRVDFRNVQEQAAWVCQCDASLVERLEEDFKMTLQQQNSLEAWANWLKSVVDEVLKPFEGQKTYINAARQFLLKWSFYSSMVIRDLTLRSAASFGSFHLIRLLYDEYMFYIIEHQIAKVTGETPISVMGEAPISPALLYSEDPLMENGSGSQCNNMDMSVGGTLTDNTASLLLSNETSVIHSKRMKMS